MTDMHRRYLVTVNASVIQTARTTDVTIITDTHVLDRTRIEYHHVAADGTDSGCMLIGIEIGDLLHPRNQLRTMAVKRHDVCLMCRELITDKHLAATGLIQDRHLHTITELGQTVYKDNIHILNESVVPDFIIGNVVLDILNATVVTHRYIMKRHMPQTGMFPYSARQSKL